MTNLMVQNQEVVSKSIRMVIQNEETEKIKIIVKQFLFQLKRINIHEILMELDPELLAFPIRVYDFSKNCYDAIAFGQTVDANSINSQNKILLIKIGKRQQKSSDYNNSEKGDAKSETTSVKKERSKQRIIYDVIDIVKKWRELHLSKNNYRKISLNQAAKIIGLPKKSLDDYYYQLRLGEKYKFDFKTHLFDRIGVLRTYLKNQKEGITLATDRLDKHPKKLQIIDDFDQLEEVRWRRNQDIQAIEQENYEQEMKIQENQYQMEVENNQGIQVQFYNEFEFLLNEKDPFLLYDFNFKKKQNESNPTQEYFF